MRLERPSIARDLSVLSTLCVVLTTWVMLLLEFMMGVLSALLSRCLMSELSLVGVSMVLVRW